MVVFCRVVAVGLIAGAIAGLLLGPPFLSHRDNPTIVLHGGVHVVATLPSATKTARVGDVVDLRGTSVAERYRIFLPTLASGWFLPIERQGQTRRVFVPAAPPKPWSSDSLFLLSGVLELLVALCGAIILWRRPSVLAVLFGLFCAESIPTEPVIFGITPFPDGVLNIFGPAWFALTNDIGLFALLPFVMRFPAPPRSRAGIVVMRAADAALALAVVSYVVRDAAVYPGDYGDPWWVDVVPAVAAIVALVVMTIVRFARSSGFDRRRLGWVLAGTCVSGASLAIGFSSASNAGPITYPEWVDPATTLSDTLLPLALAYAILRHRVLDLGFVLNRTLIYALITLALVVVVSFIDWLSSRFILGGRFSLELEAIVAVAFGVALNWMHRRVDTFVDRVFFWERHQAERRLEERMHALDYAKHSATVDETLVDETVAILRLTSAAVYRRDADGTYACAAKWAWPQAAPFEEDDLLVRTLRAREATVRLQESGIADARFPSGEARPEIAIPLAIRHDLRGFVLYGHRSGDVALDPEERRLLEAAARQAAIAYDAIEADAYRREALSMRPLSAAEIAPDLTQRLLDGG